MRKSPSAVRFMVCALFLLGLSGLRAYGQERGEREEPKEHHNGVVQDWTTRHAVYPRWGEIHDLIKAQNDPRAIQSWQETSRREWRRWRRDHDPERHRVYDTEPGLHTDWSISLGGGSMAKSMYPAKFGFDPTVAPSCANDFVVYTVNVAGGAAQPNIVGFNQLYSGTNPSNGICNRASSGSDTGVDAEVMWSYNVTAADGVMATSPTLSSDGTKVAFVEKGAGGTAHFHVLAWKSSDGVNAGNLQSTLSPKQLTSGFDLNAPAGGSGAVTDLTLTPSSGITTNSDTLSSPFVNYAADLAYVGNDSGTLFRIKNVFCTVSCTPGTGPAPSIDSSFGGANGLATGCTGILTGAVEDFGTGNIFVGCSDGKLYGFTSAGVALSGSPLTVGDGSATGGIVDPPLVDNVNKVVYVVTGKASSGGTQAVVQASAVDLSSPKQAAFGPGGSFNLHAPILNSKYYSSALSTDWALFEVSSNGSNIAGYQVGFSGLHVMNTSSTTTAFSPGPNEVSPLTEFNDGVEDRFFESFISGSGGNLASFNITLGTIPAGPPEANQNEGNGTTGIVIDNSGTSTIQADSLYFGTLEVAAGHAVKLTQSGLH